MNNTLPPSIQRIVSGGQTGTDRAALDAAVLLKIEIGGWCPKGRWAEDGPIDLKYPLKETELAAVEQRTEFNARDSDGTLILTWGKPTGGTLFTVECVEKHNRPYYLLDMEVDKSAGVLQKIELWRQQYMVSTLNVAGPRESLKPGTIYSESFLLLKELFSMTAAGAA